MRGEGDRREIRKQKSQQRGEEKERKKNGNRVNYYSRLCEITFNQSGGGKGREKKRREKVRCAKEFRNANAYRNEIIPY